MGRGIGDGEGAPPAPGGRTANDDMRPQRVPRPVGRADTAEKPRAQGRSGAPPGLNILCQVFAKGAAARGGAELRYGKGQFLDEFQVVVGQQINARGHQPMVEILGHCEKFP